MIYTLCHYSKHKFVKTAMEWFPLDNQNFQILESHFCRQKHHKQVLLIPWSLVSFLFVHISLGSWMITTPHSRSAIPKRSRSNLTYIYMGSFPSLSEISWNKLCALTSSPCYGFVLGNIFLSKHLWYLRVTWLPESGSEGMFLPCSSCGMLLLPSTLCEIWLV